VRTPRLDPLAKEVLNNVYGILERRGRSVEDDAFSQLLIWWWNDPQYCSNGVPAPLPAKGDAPSIAALVRRLGRRYSLRAAMDYLCSARAMSLHLLTHLNGPMHDDRAINRGPIF
jgi:hypothetical protein